MPAQLPIPEKPQHGAGKFEANNVFNGLAGLRFSWETTFGWFLPQFGAKLATALGSKQAGTAIDPVEFAALFGTGTEAVLEQIGKGLTATQSGVADAHVTHAAALDGIAAAIAINASDTLKVKKHVSRRTAPVIITKIIRPNVQAQIAPYARRTAAAEARAAAAERKAAALEARIVKLEKGQAKLDSAVVGDLPGRIGLIDHDLAGVKGQLRKLGKWATIGGFLLLLAKALSKMGLGWVRCSNVKRYGRSLCGMNTNLLEGLLADALLITSLISVVEFAKELQAIETEVVKGISLGVRELKPGYKAVAGNLH
jgi:hypothetical protein